jgi:hypothetical protein
VWYTEKTDFDAVVSTDAVKTGNLSGYFTDTSKWFYSMSSNQNITYNVINYTGYDSGSGTENEPFRTAKYDQKHIFEEKQVVTRLPMLSILFNMAMESIPPRYRYQVMSTAQIHRTHT